MQGLAMDSLQKNIIPGADVMINFFSDFCLHSANKSVVLLILANEAIPIHLNLQSFFLWKAVKNVL
jgi:hypothetical protein